MAKDPNAQAEKLYLQMLELIEEASSVFADAANDDEEDDEHKAMTDEELVDAVVAEAGERGLDEDHVERVFKAIDGLVRKSAEG